MQSSSIKSAIAALQSELNSVDVDDLSGAELTSLIALLIPLRNQVEARLMAASVRAIARNQHNTDGAPSATAWMGARLGISENRARAHLAANKCLAELPDLASAFRSGSLSHDKMAVIGRGVDGDETHARSLLANADTDTVEALQRRVQEIRNHDSGFGRQKRLRRSQFVHLAVDRDSMVNGRFRLTSSAAASLMGAFGRARGIEAWERAEDFAFRLGESGSKRVETVFHLDVQSDSDGAMRFEGRCEQQGVGSVPLLTALEAMEQAAWKLVGTINNKLVWFSESDRRSTTKDLPEFVKRVIRFRHYDTCSTNGCTKSVDQIDHIRARSNGGDNRFENLQGLCETCHHAKTKDDAPWTAGGIYGKARDKRAQERSRLSGRIMDSEPDEWEDELFPDTG